MQVTFSIHDFNDVHGALHIGDLSLDSIVVVVKDQVGGRALQIVGVNVSCSTCFDWSSFVVMTPLHLVNLSAVLMFAAI